MDNDFYERSVSKTSNETGDHYTVTDSNDSNFAFTVDFPDMTAEWYAYSIINQIPPRGVPAGMENSPNPQPVARTVDRYDNAQPYYGFSLFDIDLGKPIWFVGSGTTGWVDASGAQV